MKKLILVVIPFIISLGCGVAYKIIGCEIAPDGTLLEPFYLIPIGYLFFTIGIIGLLVVALSCLIKHLKAKKMRLE